METTLKDFSYMWPLSEAVYKKSIKKQNKIQKKYLKELKQTKKSGLYMSHQLWH